jgi:hypothetical protein
MMMGVEDEIRREAMGYESREDTARRMGGHGIPTARAYKPKAGPILWVGRVVFGLLTLLGLYWAVYGKFHGIEQDDAMVRRGGAAIVVFGAMFLLTFVRRAF